MSGGDFLSHSAAKTAWMYDVEVCDAIDIARRSFSDFARTFSKPRVRQTDFFITALRREREKLVPWGVLIEHIEGDIIKGRQISNALISTPGAETICTLESVID